LSFHENLSDFQGQPVVDWVPGLDVGANAIRLRVEYDEASDGGSIERKLAELLEADGVDRLQSLVIGSWSPDDSGVDSAALVEQLVAARPKLPGLRNLFFGDIIGEECECSWIRLSDLSALLAAYEQIEHFTVRAGEGLTFGTLQHDRLKELVVQTGGLPASVLHEIATAKLPALERLELYLGDPGYGGDATVDDLAPLLRGAQFPNLRYLGLKDSAIADEVAGVVALAPVVGHLDVLDLSMGTLGDAGARSLLASPAVRRLKKLDLHYHYISDAVAAELKALGIEVDLSDPQSPDGSDDPDDRYVAVSE
jgi:hypothetical protein